MDLDSILDEAFNDSDGEGSGHTDNSSSETVEPKEKNANSSASVQTKVPVPSVQTKGPVPSVQTKGPVPSPDTEEVEKPDFIDSILDDALNDLDHEELVDKASTANKKEDENNSDDFELSGGDFEKTFQHMATQLMEGRGMEQSGELRTPQNLDASIDQAVKMISDGAKNMSEEPQFAEMFSKMEMDGMEDFFKEIMTSLDDMDKDGKESVDEMVEKMFGQMLQREHFEGPMRDIAKKYPAWLEENESKYSAEEFENYKKQYGCFQRILECYQTEKVDTNNIMELMKEMQLYGQPPDEIVADMIPTFEGDPSKMNPKDLEKCPTM